MPYKLNVPFFEKDVVKSKGAFWDSDHKTWFIPDHKNLNDFKQWIDTNSFNLIIRAPVCLAVNIRQCWKCKNETTVVSLYSDDFYQLGYKDEKAKQETFENNEASCFFRDITFIDNDISQFFIQNIVFFKLGFSKTVNGKYWVNHCIKCDALQGDNFNHSEPGGPFFPITENECKKLTLIQLPLKYDVSINGDPSYSSLGNLIFNLAKRKTWTDVANVLDM